ncbi:MAG: hypothetical protein LBH26_01010, partial [Treponema sp.]|nr:hypothetical protein [Treponema sp.]
MGILNFLFLIGVLIIIAVVSTYMGRARMQKAGASNKVFLEKYPGAAKVYPYSRASISSEMVMVHSVDGQSPEFFYESGKNNSIVASITAVIATITGKGGNGSGFYLKPGTSAVEMSYYHNRPGIFYKNVTSTTDVIKKE